MRETKKSCKQKCGRTKSLCGWCMRRGIARSLVWPVRQVVTWDSERETSAFAVLYRAAFLNVCPPLYHFRLHKYSTGCNWHQSQCQFFPDRKSRHNVTINVKRLRKDRRGFPSRWKAHPGALLDKLNLLLLVTLLVSLPGNRGQRLPRTGYHPQVHQWYEYHWLRNTGIGKNKRFFVPSTARHFLNCFPHNSSNFLCLACKTTQFLQKVFSLCCDSDGPTYHLC